MNTLGFELTVALRFLREGRLQTLFIVSGVAIGVGVIVTEASKHASDLGPTPVIFTALSCWKRLSERGCTVCFSVAMVERGMS